MKGWVWGHPAPLGSTNIYNALTFLSGLHLKPRYFKLSLKTNTELQRNQIKHHLKPHKTSYRKTPDTKRTNTGPWRRVSTLFIMSDTCYKCLVFCSVLNSCIISYIFGCTTNRSYRWVILINLKSWDLRVRVLSICYVQVSSEVEP